MARKRLPNYDTIRHNLDCGQFTESEVATLNRLLREARALHIAAGTWDDIRNQGHVDIRNILVHLEKPLKVGLTPLEKDLLEL